MAITFVLLKIETWNQRHFVSLLKAFQKYTICYDVIAKEVRQNDVRSYVIFPNFSLSKTKMKSMHNSPDTPHVKFQPIWTYGYDVTDVCLWRFYVIPKFLTFIRWCNLSKSLKCSLGFIGSSAYMFHILFYTYLDVRLLRNWCQYHLKIKYPFLL